MADEIKNKDKWRNLCVYNEIPPLFPLKNREILLLKYRVKTLRFLMLPAHYRIRKRQILSF